MAIKPGTNVKILEPVIDPVSWLIGVYVEWAPAGSVGIVLDDGKTVGFANGTSEKLSKINHQIITVTKGD